MPNKTLAEQILKGLADAVTDIREKVVEEPWYGRVLTGPQELEGKPDTGFEVSVSLTVWPQAREANQPAGGEHDRDNAPDIDMDR